MNHSNSNVRIQILNLKDRLQSKCKCLSLVQPVYYHYVFHNQKIPVICIGKIIFHTKNLMMDDNSKWVKLLNDLDSALNSKEFLNENIKDLSCGMLDDAFAEVFDLSSNTSCLVNTSIAHAADRFVELKF